MQIAVREFKAGISAYLSMAQQGQRLEITSHKRPIAVVTGLPALANKADTQRLGALLSHPAISWGGKRLSPRQPLPLSEQGTPLGEMVLQDR